jgi:hypothetical protein
MDIGNSAILILFDGTAQGSLPADFLDVNVMSNS